MADLGSYGGSSELLGQKAALKFQNSVKFKVLLAALSIEPDFKLKDVIDPPYVQLIFSAC